MGLFDDLQKSTKTNLELEEAAQLQRELQDQKRINALNKKIESIKKSIFDETKIAASKGIRVLTITPYYLCESPELDSDAILHMSFHMSTPYERKGHMYKTSEYSSWYDLYELHETYSTYGYILPQDGPYIIKKTEEFLTKEGFQDFRIEFEVEYRAHRKFIFKSPTGRKILKIHLSW